MVMEVAKKLLSKELKGYTMNIQNYRSGKIIITLTPSGIIIHVDTLELSFEASEVLLFEILTKMDLKPDDYELQRRNVNKFCTHTYRKLDEYIEITNDERFTTRYIGPCNDG